MCERSHTLKREIRSKRYYIIQYKLNNPTAKAREIAEKCRSSTGYVNNVLSRHGKSVSLKREGYTRSNGRVSGHGLSFYEDRVLSSWYEDLRAPVLNARTGMKQIGFKSNGDPCTCQIHRGGRIIVFPHSLEWRNWLAEELVRKGWEKDRAELLVQNLHYTLKVAEGGVRVTEGFLPKDLLLKTDWGMVVVKDDSPTKNTLELKLSIPDMKKFLGLPEISHQLQILTQGTLTYNQSLRALIPLLVRLNNQLNSRKEGDV